MVQKPPYITHICRYVLHSRLLWSFSLKNEPPEMLYNKIKKITNMWILKVHTINTYKWRHIQRGNKYDLLNNMSLNIWKCCGYEQKKKNTQSSTVYNDSICLNLNNTSW